MSAKGVCPFRVCLEGGEVLCLDPWFVRTIPRGRRFVRDFCLGDFHACPFYQMQKIYKAA